MGSNCQTKSFGRMGPWDISWKSIRPGRSCKARTWDFILLPSNKRLPGSKNHPGGTDRQRHPMGFFWRCLIGLKCGGGATLFLNSTHHFQITMGLGTGSNNYVELMALKILLCFGIERNYKKIQIFGDSSVIINWINKTQKCRNLSLSALFEEAFRHLSHFYFITCKHVYKERNKEADRLSKTGLELEMGTWRILEWKEAVIYELFHRPFIDPLLGIGSS